MGRHSAPDDDEAADGPLVVTTDPAAAAAADLSPEAAAAAAARGRHSRTEDAADTGPVPGLPMRPSQERAAAQDERPTELLALADIAAAERQPEAAPAPETATEPEPGGEAEPAAPVAEPVARPPRPRAGQATGADLALIRRHPDVRNRVLGAVLVPFVLYAAVLVLLGAPAVHYLLWIWIPMVTAGVLVGLLLDAGHKRYPNVPEE